MEAFKDTLPIVCNGLDWRQTENDLLYTNGYIMVHGND